MLRRSLFCVKDFWIVDDFLVWRAAKNKFVQLAIERTLSLALEMRGAQALRNSLSSDINITILGDNDFYSQRAQVYPT